MPKCRRSQILTDEAVQGELLFRAIVYWFFCLMTVSLLVIAWAAYAGPPRPLAEVVRASLAKYAPAIFGSVILLPIVLIDVLRVSNRFVGPIHQVRNTLRRLAANEPADPVMLRKDDFWQELAFYTNQVAVKMNWGEDADNDDAHDSESPSVQADDQSDGDADLDDADLDDADCELSDAAHA